MVTIARSHTYTVALTINMLLCFDCSKTQLFVIVYHPGYVQILAQKMLKLQDICWNVCPTGGINKESFITGKSLRSENRKAVENIKRLRNSLKTGSFIFVKCK